MDQSDALEFIRQLETDNETLRRELWLSHGHAGLYGDDGEMQCGICALDYKRAPVSVIAETLARRRSN